MGHPGHGSSAGNDARGLSPMAAFLANRHGDRLAVTGNCFEVWCNRLWSLTLAVARLILSFQPSELVKLVLALYIADWLARKGNQVGTFLYGLAPFVILVGIV